MPFGLVPEWKNSKWKREITAIMDSEKIEGPHKSQKIKRIHLLANDVIQSFG
jgi:hypothetical protein